MKILLIGSRGCFGTEFKKISKVPIILNTSFNTNNVPIVESPKDALTTFYSCGIDVLYMNNIKIREEIVDLFLYK